MRKKTLTIKHYELPVEIEKEKSGGYVARCPIWPECYAQGETIEEALNEISYVASSLIELYQEENLKTPREIKAGTIKSIIKQVGISPEEFYKL